jgi:hypothetical protein
MTTWWEWWAAAKYGSGAAAAAVAGIASTAAAIGIGLGGWLVAAWLVTAMLVARGAAGRGRSGVGWFLLAILLAPPVAALMLLVLPDRAEARQRAQARIGKGGLRLCPSCAEVVRQEARCCRYCGVDLERLDKERERLAAREQPAQRPALTGEGRRAEPMIST